MTSQAQCFCAANLRDNIVNHGHAMPINPGKLWISGGIAKCDTPLCIFAQGCSVPISRGSPPTFP